VCSWKYRWSLRTTCRTLCSATSCNSHHICFINLDRFTFFHSENGGLSVFIHVECQIAKLTGLSHPDTDTPSLYNRLTLDTDTVCMYNRLTLDTDTLCMYNRLTLDTDTLCMYNRLT